MSTPSSPDDGLDLGAVADDDALVEALRAGTPGVEDDLALDVLAALLADVSQDLPEPAVLLPRAPQAEPAQVLPLRRRSPAKVALATVVGLAVLGASGGVAAAAAGSPLRPLRDAVAAAVGDLVEAVTPDRTFRPSGVAPSSPSPVPPAPTAGPDRSASPPARPSAAAARSAPAAGGVPGPGPLRPTPSGPAAVSRSQGAAVQVDRALDKAEQALDARRLEEADAHLDRAERTLPQVLPADGRAPLAARLDALRTRLEALSSATPSAAPAPARSRPERSRPEKTRGPGRGGAARPAATPAAEQRGTPGAEGPSGAPAARPTSRATSRGTSRGPSQGTSQDPPSGGSGRATVPPGRAAQD